jgi:hypothetical protein
MQKKSEGLLADDNPGDEDESGGARIFFKLLEKVGAFGRYQVMTITLWCLIMYLNGGLMFMTPFLFYEDPYDCEWNKTIPPADCKRFVCDLHED